MESYGLVLSGGGAKGGYEIGVWKALKELGIHISSIVGTSVGALNGAMMVQGDFETTYKLWTSLSIDSVIKIEKDISSFHKTSSEKIDIMGTIKNIITSGGIDTTPLKEMLHEIIDEDRIRQSNIDFGIVTFSLSDFKSVELFKNDIPYGKLVDYLLASCCLPTFTSHEIDGKLFIDGGIYDNMPVSMLSNKGIKKIIVIDIDGPGVVRKIDPTGLDIIKIETSEDLGGILEFDGERTKRNINIGYLDALRAFGKVRGIKYYLAPGGFESYKRAYVDSLETDDFKMIYNFLGIDWNKRSSPSNKLIIDVIIRIIKQYTDGDLSSTTLMPAMAEIAAEQLKVERSAIYTLKELTDIIIKEYEIIRISSEYENNKKLLNRMLSSISPTDFNRRFKLNPIEEKFLISYQTAFSENEDNSKRYRRLLSLVSPKICIANLFISLVLSKQSNEKMSL